MEASELRIGNLVHIEGMYAVVHGLNLWYECDDDKSIIMDVSNTILRQGVSLKGTIGLLDQNNTRRISKENEVEPIPLTEEILLKCGFDENMVLSTIEGEIRYYGDGDINIGGEDSCTLGMVYIAKCKYLHQLQNLYFALTGEELKIKWED